MGKNVDITEDLLIKYDELREKQKEIEAEMSRLKQQFHHYLDFQYGKGGKGEEILGRYLLQRQLRESFSFDDDKTVQILEELNLNDCIRTIRKPDEEKISAAITLGILDESKIADCKVKKVTQAIIVRRI